MELHRMLKAVELLPEMKFPVEMRWQSSLRNTEN